MDPDQHICLCFHVSQRKIVNFIRREKPAVPSKLSECLGAGTGCHWCVPTLERLWDQWRAGEEPGIELSPEAYAAQRKHYRKTGERPEGLTEDQAS